MVGWHHRLNGHEFEQAPRDGEGQGSLAWCSPLDRKESEMTEPLNNTTTGPGLGHRVLFWEWRRTKPYKLLFKLSSSSHVTYFVPFYTISTIPIKATMPMG